MSRPKRVYVSVPRDHHLDERQRSLKHAILDKIRREGLEPQEFQVSGLPHSSPYTFGAVSDIMSRYHGALVLAFARWKDPSGRGNLSMPTVWNHFEGVFALAMKKQLLVITEIGVATDGITWVGGGQMMLWIPSDAGPEWVNTPRADSGTLLQEDPSATVTVVGYAVNFDAERRLWFADIRIETDNAYWPFVRLALARFQPQSINGAFISQSPARISSSFHQTALLKSLWAERRFI